MTIYFVNSVKWWIILLSAWVFWRMLIVPGLVVQEWVVPRWLPRALNWSTLKFEGLHGCQGICVSCFLQHSSHFLNCTIRFVLLNSHQCKLCRPLGVSWDVRLWGIDYMLLYLVHMLFKFSWGCMLSTSILILILETWFNKQCVSSFFSLYMLKKTHLDTWRNQM